MTHEDARRAVKVALSWAERDVRECARGTPERRRARRRARVLARLWRRILDADRPRYAAFQRGWDGYDAEPITQDTIRRAVSVIELLSALGATGIDPSPISDGRIDVEGTVRGYTIHVTVPRDGLELLPYRLAYDLVRALGAAAESRSDLVPACVALIAPLRRHAVAEIRDLVLEVTAEVDLVAGLALATELAEDPYPTVREAAASVLARLGSLQPGELTHLAERIGRTQRPDLARRVLLPLLDHVSPLVREGAIRGLRLTGPDDDVRAALTLRTDPEREASPGVRAAAREALDLTSDEPLSAGVPAPTTRARARVRSVDRSTAYEGPALSTCEDCPLRGRGPR